MSKPEKQLQLELGTELTVPTHFILQHPDVEDTLGGGHHRLAKALSRLIKQSKSPGPIALIGPLGSGKSTVISLLSKLITTDETLILIFDTWSHEKDPLRTSFLESLIRSLLSKQWLNDKDYWEEKVKLITGQISRSTTVKKDFPTGTLAAIFCAGIMLNTVMTLVTNLQSKDPELCYVLMVEIIGALGLMVTIYRKSDSFRSKVLAKHIKEEISTTSTTTMRDASPTEFNRNFAAVVDCALRHHEQRKLIIVLDNIDRSSSTLDMGKLWSILETFFHHSDLQNNWLERLWLIVPLAEKQEAEESSASNRVIDRELLTKMFMVQYRMPRLATHIATTFLNEQICRGFASISKEEQWSCVQIFRLVNGIYSSPREIKHFVNSLVALNAEWENELSLPVIAAYVMYQNQDITTLLTGRSMSASVLQILSDYDWVDQFLQLHFHIPAADARNVLIENQIDEALITGTVQGLEPFLNLPGFRVVVQNSFANLLNQMADSVQSMGHCASALEQLDPSGADDYARLWHKLAMLVGKHRSWFALNEASGRGLAIIIRRQSKSSVKALAVSVLKNLSKPEKTSDARSYCSGVIEIFKPLIDFELEKVIDENFVLPPEVEFISGLVFNCRLKKVPSNMIPLLKPNLEVVKQTFLRSDLTKYYAANLRTAFELWTDVEWPAIGSMLVSKMSVAALSGASSDLYFGLNALLWLSLKTGTSSDVLTKLVESGTFFGWLGSTPDIFGKTACLTAIMLTDPKAEHIVKSRSAAYLAGDGPLARDEGLRICESMPEDADLFASRIVQFLMEGDLADLSLPKLGDGQMLAGLVGRVQKALDQERKSVIQRQANIEYSEEPFGDDVS